ncbi:hypothetical protein MtrunA17_Chr2g0310251 [Medicago truncatula]|uniref:Uncharacterized protein n=1 Tax=Medicago truncatula TaxID=3880 RepID=A0A396JD92_MEDTR|nr:hypothetical protein MtrunA17_Chr2g0310251 [Medicago truncatula]
MVLFGVSSIPFEVAEENILIPWAFGSISVLTFIDLKAETQPFSDLVIFCGNIPIRNYQHVSLPVQHQLILLFM